MMEISSLVNPSSGLILGERVERLAEKLKGLIPNIDIIVEYLKYIKEKYCKPLLLRQSQEVEEYLSQTLPLFVHSVIPATSSLSQYIIIKRDSLEKFEELEKQLFEDIKITIEKAAFKKGIDAEKIIRAHAALVDFDIWAFDSIKNFGLEGFMKGLFRVDSEMISDFLRKLYSLFYIILSIDVALLEDAPYDERTLRRLTELGDSYAIEVEDYLDTLMFLVSYEGYEAITNFLLKRRNE